MKEQLIFQRILKKKYEELRHENPRLSRRDFSKSMGLSAGAISEIFNGQRKVSLKLAKRIARKLKLDPQARVELFDAFGKYAMKPRRVRSQESPSLGAKFLRLSSDQYRIIEDWHHFAILALMDTLDFKSDTQWIAARLGMNLATARAAIERLIRLGIVQEDENGHFIKTGKSFHTPDDVPDASIRLAHCELLEKARNALDALPVDERDFTSLLVNVSPEQLPRAKEMIREFRSKFMAELEADPQSDVYQLGIQFFPLTQIKKGTKKERKDQDES